MDLLFHGKSNLELFRILAFNEDLQEEFSIKKRKLN